MLLPSGNLIPLCNYQKQILVPSSPSLFILLCVVGMNCKSEWFWLLMTTDLVLGLVVELVGQPGEVVADLLAHGNLYLLALAAPRPRHAHALRPRRVQEEDSRQEHQHCRPHGRGCRCHCVAPSSSSSAVVLAPASLPAAVCPLAAGLRCLSRVSCFVFVTTLLTLRLRHRHFLRGDLLSNFCSVLFLMHFALALRFFCIHQSVRWKADADATVSFV